MIHVKIQKLGTISEADIEIGVNTTDQEKFKLFSRLLPESK
jgi:hypothetical protein